MRKRAVLCSVIWAVIRHEEPEEVPSSGVGTHGRLLAETEGSKEKGVLSRGKQIYKGWS